MTRRLTLGVDPGQSGCVALLADDVPVGFVDMPTWPRKAGGRIVDAVALADTLRAALALHAGAYALAVFEQVNAMPGQGVSSGFRFGQADGIARGVIGALGIGVIEVPPATWKRHFHLCGAGKDAARTYAAQRFPAIANRLRRKGDIGRADALLVALWAYQTEQVGGRGV
jgi:crossover junction endodeoxyribonuclease RuvC